MNVLTLMLIQVVLVLLPLVVMMCVHRYHNRPNKLYTKGVPIGVLVLLYTFVVLYLYIFVHYSPKVLNHYYPLQSETKMICESKTTYWREGIKY